MFGDASENGSRIRIKICGITNAVDALAAIDCGADALGFNFYPRSKRYIDTETAREWIEKLPLGICRVAVLVDPIWTEASRISELPFIDALQLHGNESPEFCQRLAETGIRFAKALPVRHPKSLADIPSFSTDTLVLDSPRRGEFGGAGKTFPWQWARGFIEAHPSFRVDTQECCSSCERGSSFRGGCDDWRRVAAGPERSHPFASLYRSCARSQNCVGRALFWSGHGFLVRAESLLGLVCFLL